MKVERVFHIRLPLVIATAIGKRYTAPLLVPGRANFNGGATVVAEADTEKPGFVTIRAAQCRWSDNYNRKLGVKTAKAKDPEVISLRELPAYLADIEEGTLMQCIPWLRNAAIPLSKHHKEAVEDLTAVSRNWEHTIRYFLPKVGHAT